MTQQINLYDPALRAKRDWLALSNVLAGMAIAAALVVAAGFLARGDLAQMQAQVAAGEAQLKALREQVQALEKQHENRKADPHLERELDEARQQAAAHRRVLETLQQGLAVATPPFAEYLRALARQSIPGVWLTGFVWDTAGDSLEIRGRTTDPALLPEYIRRLSREPVFRGRAFAALNVAEGQLEPTAATATPPAAKPATPEVLPKAQFHEFTLAPRKTSETAATAATTETTATIANMANTATSAGGAR